MNLAATLWNGLRAIALRAPRTNPVEAGPGLFFVLVLIYVGITFAIAAFEVERPWTFAPDGITTVLTDSLLTLVAAWVVMRVMQRDGIVWGVAAVLLSATIMLSIVVHAPVAWIVNALLARQHVVIALLLDLVSRWWWLLVLIAIAHGLAPRHLARTIGAAILGYAISAASWWWLPQASVLRATAGDTSIAAAPDADQDDDATETAQSAQKSTFDAEEVMYDQTDLLDDAIAKLKPQTPGVVDLYVVAFAGDGDEDVFRNEAEYAEQLFAKRFNADGRVLVLENNAATVATRPLATLTNLTWALDGIAKKMDPSEDVLLVYLTSHGSHDHQLAVVLDPLPLDQISPENLADALDTKPGIRWKVVVVNACYSGGFIDALRDDSTMVITSARTDRTSFGCGADSDITYFGKAFLAQALNETTSIPDAFETAKKSVAEWETADQETHSEPQIATSGSIEHKLDAWRRALPERPQVPFAPASSE